MEAVFEKLFSYLWKIKLSKCQFIQDEVKYLGHKVGNGIIAPLDVNIDQNYYRLAFYVRLLFLQVVLIVFIYSYFVYIFGIS